MNDLDVPEALFTHHRSRHLDGILTALDTDHLPRRTDTLGEEVEATLRSASDFDDPRSGCDRELIKQPRRFVGEPSRLFLQSLLLGSPVPQQVRVPMCHLALPHFGAANPLPHRRPLRPVLGT